MKLYFDVKNQVITRTDRNQVIANSADYLEAEITFSDEWSSLEKTMTFKNGNLLYTYVLENNKILADNHLNLGVGTWKVSIQGVSGDQKIITNECNLAVNASGWIGSEAIPPESIWNQLLVIIESLHTEVASTAALRSAVQKYIEDNYDALVKEEVIVDDVRAALDDMAEDGTLSDLLAPLVAAGMPEVVANQISAVVAAQIGATVASQIGAVVASQITTPVNQAVKNYCDDNFSGWSGALDRGLTQPLMAAPADMVGAIKSALTSIKANQITTYRNQNGNIGADGTWNNVGTSYQHIVFPVNSGDVVKLKLSSGQSSYLAVVKSYSTPVEESSIAYSDAVGYTSRISFSDAEKVLTIPSDAHYVLIQTKMNNNSITFAEFLCNEYDYMKTVPQNVHDVIYVDGIRTALQKMNCTPISALERHYGNISTGGTWNNVNSNYQHIAVPVNSGDKVTINVDENTSIFAAVVKSYTEAVDGATIDFSTASGFTGRLSISSATNALVMPSDAHFIILEIIYGGQTKTIDNLIINFYDYEKSVSENMRHTVNDFKWCAMGDSITEGYISYLNSGTPSYKVSRQDSWVDKVSRINMWNVTNLGIGGTGWNLPTPEQVSQGIDTTSAKYVAQHTDFSSYSLVTLAYGINDWKANKTTGSVTDATTANTTIGGMKATIEAIMTSNPLCKIIVILPINCAGYSFEFGDESTNYALGYELSNSGTLEEFVTALMSVCDYYGIQYIDQAHYSSVNRKNILSCLIDGVHPCADAHTLLAYELSKKITF